MAWWGIIVIAGAPSVLVGMVWPALVYVWPHLHFRLRPKSALAAVTV